VRTQQVGKFGPRFMRSYTQREQQAVIRLGIQRKAQAVYAGQ
jgi:hypothetical protein